LGRNRDIERATSDELLRNFALERAALKQCALRKMPFEKNGALRTMRVEKMPFEKMSFEKMNFEKIVLGERNWALREFRFEKGRPSGRPQFGKN